MKFMTFIIKTRPVKIFTYINTASLACTFLRSTVSKLLGIFVFFCRLGDKGHVNLILICIHQALHCIACKLGK